MSRRKSAPQSNFALFMYLEAIYSKSLNQISIAPLSFITDFLISSIYKRKTLNDLFIIVDKSFYNLEFEKRSKSYNYLRSFLFFRYNEEIKKRV